MEHESSRAYARQNEEMLRGANAKIERDADESGESDARPTRLLCECAEACGSTISISFNEWETVHAAADNHFTVAHGHEAPAVERVVERRERYLVVEKFPVASG